MAPAAQDVRAAAHAMTNAELVHLRIRLIAIENILVAVLSEGSERQREVARDIAELISPRPDSTPHPLTI